MRMLNIQSTTAIATPFGDMSLFTRINKIEINYNVSIVLFSKYKRLFTHLIAQINHDTYKDDIVPSSTFLLDEKNSDLEEMSSLEHKSKKLRSSNSHILEENDQVKEDVKDEDSSDFLIKIDDLFKFGWIFFIYIKGMTYL